MEDIEQIDISGDAGLRIRGNSLEQLLEHAAAGMIGLITDSSTIEEGEHREIRLDADTHEQLLVQWLNELIFLFDTYNFIGKEFPVRIQGTSLRANVSGGILDPDRHERKLLVKAATYHHLSIKKIDSLWEATVIFDI